MKIAFFDRDGVINKKAEEHHYITRVEDFVFNKSIFQLFHKLKKLGFEFIVITNQRGVARGLYTEQDLKNIHDHMCQKLTEQGITLLDIFYCPHDIGQCDCRKPQPGLLEQACKKYTIDLSKSALISDSKGEIEMGKLFGIKKSIYIESDTITDDTAKELEQSTL